MQEASHAVWQPWMQPKAWREYKCYLRKTRTHIHRHAPTKALILTVFIPDTKTVKDAVGLVGGQCRISFLEGVFPAPMLLYLAVA